MFLIRNSQELRPAFLFPDAYSTVLPGKELTKDERVIGARCGIRSFTRKNACRFVTGRQKV